MNLSRTIFFRLLNVIPLLLFLPLITFVLMHFMPGSYFDTLRMNPQISQETIAKYESMYHLDEPVLIQYFYWLRQILHLDFGYSFAYQQPVLTVLSGRLFNTLLLSTVSFLLAWVLGVFFGLLAGMKPDSFLNRALGLFAYAGLSIPGFFLCLILLMFISQGLPLPLGGMKSVGYEDLSVIGKIMDIAAHMAVPVTVLTIGSFAFIFRFMRAQTREAAGSDFVLFLKACRVPQGRITFKHVGRNAINPLISLFGLELPALFSGAALIEIITGWPGLGQMMLQAARTQDIFLVLGNMVMIAVLLVAGNLIADILLVVMDPRIRFQGRQV